MKEPIKVEIGNGQTAVMLVPENTNEWAIVDLKVLQRLTELLPRIDFDAMRQKMIEKIEKSMSIEQYVANLENETAFHRTVNIIKEYKPEQ